MATRQGKLKLGTSSWFVKRRLSWLPQEDLVREADFCPLPEVLGGGLWLGLVVSHHDGSVVAQAILEHAPDVNDLATLLAEAMQRPLMEQTRSEKLLKWEEVFADLIDYLKSGEWKQPVIDIAGDVEGGDERQDRLLGLRLAVILYPAVRKANKTK